MSTSEAASIPRVTPVQFVASLLIAAGLLWWFSRGVDLEAVATRLADARLSYLLAAVAVSLGTMTYRAVRWRALIAPLGRPSLRALVSCIYMGWAVSAVLPGRLGEMARPILLGRREDMSRSALFGTVVFERVLDVLAVLVLLAVYLTFVLPSRGSEGEVVPLLLALRAGGWLLLGSIAGGAVVVGIANRLPQRVTDFVKTAVERLPGPVGRRGWHILSSFGTGLLAAWAFDLSSRQRVRLQLAILTHTAVVWLGVYSVHLLLFQAFAIDVSVYGVMPLISMIAVGLMVPLPAAVGSYHNAVQIALTVLLGVPVEVATGYAVVSHAVAYVPSVSIGLFLLTQDGTSIAKRV